MKFITGHEIYKLLEGNPFQSMSINGHQYLTRCSVMIPRAFEVLRDGKVYGVAHDQVEIFTIIASAVNKQQFDQLLQALKDIEAVALEGWSSASSWTKIREIIDRTLHGQNSSDNT